MDEETKKQLNRIEVSTKRTEQAVFGDKDIGLNGLVNDVQDMKVWRGRIMKKAAGAGGAVSALIMGAKVAITNWIGGKS